MLKSSKIQFGEKEYTLQKLYHGTIDLKTIFLKSNPVRKFSVNFLTPTYFNTTKGEYPIRLPIPISIFSNLFRLYSSINTEMIFDYYNFSAWIERSVYLSSGSLSTRFQSIGKPKPVGGFVGETVFSVKKSRPKSDQDSYPLFIETLCKLGEYTNVGVNRTAGFGVIQYKPLDYF